ncbi:MAG: hypothetical protein H6Q74_2007 [Firmicutes bacterium]|nr:hypothetical protein [Bacillota bacterium]
MMVKREDNIVQAQAQRREDYEKERAKRQQRESAKREEAEQALAELSIFEYQEVDYNEQLIERKFIEPEIPDFKYLLDEAQDEVTKQYKNTFLIEGALGVLSVLVCLIFWNSLIVLVGLTGAIACAIAINRDMKNKELDCQEALKAAATDIEEKVRLAQEKIDDERNTFDEAEIQRISKLQMFLSGDMDLWQECVENVFRQLKLPFGLESRMFYQKQQSLVSLLLPDRSIIPVDKVIQSNQETMDAEETAPVEIVGKSPAEINQQYNEAMAATAVAVALKLYSALPGLDSLYVCGAMSSSEEEKDIFTFEITRQLAMDIAKCHGGLEAFKLLQATYLLGADGIFSPIEPVYPECWNNVTSDVKSVKVSC